MSEKKLTGGQDEIQAAEETKVPQGEKNEKPAEPLHVKFRKPYCFDKVDYDGVDLSGLEDLNAAALENAGRILLKNRPGLNPSTIEMTMEYAFLLAARVAGKPLEFFEHLPAQEAMKIKTVVVGFLYGGDGEN